MGHAFVLHEAVLAGRSDRLFVQTHCIGVAPLEAADLGRHQGVFVAERRWIVVGPFAQLISVHRKEFAPAVLLVGRTILIERSNRHRRVVKIVKQLGPASHGPKQRVSLVG
jgi:hypothetical protein